MSALLVAKMILEGGSAAVRGIEAMKKEGLSVEDVLLQMSELEAVFARNTAEWLALKDRNEDNKGND